MEKQTLITELKQISKDLFDKKEFQNAGRINLAIDVLEEALPQEKSSEDLENIKWKKIEEDFSKESKELKLNQIVSWFRNKLKNIN